MRFAPNRLERWRAGTYWECAAKDVTGIHARGKVWLVVRTTRGAESFRVFGAPAMLPRLEEALSVSGRSGGGPEPHPSMAAVAERLVG
jgi:hypothetical protein